MPAEVFDVFEVFEVFGILTSFGDLRMPSEVFEVFEVFEVWFYLSRFGQRAPILFRPPEGLLGAFGDQLHNYSISIVR